MQDSLGTRLYLSLAYHPQSDGKIERTIQTLEDLLRSCIMTWKGNWKEHLPLVEFIYNNSYHASIGMTPFEALYGRKCISPLCWIEKRENIEIGPDIVEQSSVVIKTIRQKL